MKKSFKVIALAVIAICLVGVGAFAKGKFFTPVTTAYYKNASTSACVQITAAVAAFDAKGTDTQAAIRDKNGTLHLVYLDNMCSALQPAKFVP